MKPKEIRQVAVFLITMFTTVAVMVLFQMAYPNVNKFITSSIATAITLFVTSRVK